MINLIIQIFAFLTSNLGYFYLNRKNKIGYIWFGIGNIILILNSRIVENYILIAMYLVWCLWNYDGY